MQCSTRTMVAAASQIVAETLQTDDSPPPPLSAGSKARARDLVAQVLAGELPSPPLQRRLIPRPGQSPRSGSSTASAHTGRSDVIGPTQARTPKSVRFLSPMSTATSACDDEDDFRLGPSQLTLAPLPMQPERPLSPEPDAFPLGLPWESPLQGHEARLKASNNPDNA